MNTLKISKVDEITMRLVHFFVTCENYQPILVNGLDNEIWLENLDKDYEIIRINANHIHNNEQLDYDNFKAKSVVKQIKKKTLSFSMNTLSILLDVGDDVKIPGKDKHLTILSIDNIQDITNSKSKLNKLFPGISQDKIKSSDNMDFFINVTNDINSTTEKKTKLYEKTFGKKTTWVTYLLIMINIIIYLLQLLGILNSSNFSMNKELVVNGEWYRLITCAFFHGGILHLICNMYSLYIIGEQLETVLGKAKFIVVYILSIFTSSLLSGVINSSSVNSVGASGAIFGLLGALLYFGYHYRLYLGSALTYEIIPVILINLIIGSIMPYIDNWGHIGGLFGGLLAAMIVGIEGKSNKLDKINGTIVYLLLTIFLIYMLFQK